MEVELILRNTYGVMPDNTKDVGEKRAKYALYVDYLLITSLTVGVVKLFIVAEAFRWLRPYRTLPFIWREINKTIKTFRDMTRTHTYTVCYVVGKYSLENKR